jgi:hypothetical protein
MKRLNARTIFEVAVLLGLMTLPFRSAKGIGPVTLRASSSSAGTDAVLAFEPAVITPSTTVFTYPTAGLPQVASRFAVADFNGDGLPDVAKLGPGVTVQFGNGAGSFSAPLALPSSVFSLALTAGDFNGDGRADLAVASGNFSNVFDPPALRVYLSDGAGFSTPSVIPLPFSDCGCGFGLAIAAGDLNGDGRLDLTILMTLSGNPGFLHVLLGDGLGGFDAPVVSNVLDADEGYVLNTRGLLVADLNNDGLADVIIPGGSQQLTDYLAKVVLGNGLGGFTSSQYFLQTGREVILGDFNHDGWLDLAGASFGAAYISSGFGPVGFSQPYAFSFDWTQFGSSSNGWALIALRPSLFAFTAAADFDGDGNLDVVTASSGRLAVQLGSSSGALSEAVDIAAASGLGMVYGVAVADFNNDGRPDIVVLDDIRGLSVFLNSTSQTTVGMNTTVVAGNATLTYSNVTTTGATTVTPISPASAGAVPGGYEVLGANAAYEIQTTATVSGLITIAFKVPQVNDPTTFASLRILHGENGVLVDRTILAPDSPAPDFASRTLYARVSSLSPFVLAVVQGPTYRQCALFDQTKAFKAGSTVPIKLQLCNAAGANVSDVSVPVVATALYKVSNSAPGVLADSGNANPDSQFRFAGGSYIYNLSLKGFSTGTYALIYRAGNDPTPHTVQFQVK